MRRLLGFVALCVVLAMVSPIVAQQRNGSLFLTVQDDQGNALTGVQVTLTGADFSRSATSDAEGNVRFIEIVPGRYEVSLKNEGFNTSILQGIEIDAGAAASMEVSLQKSDIVEEVVVTARTPLLDKRKTGTSTIFTKTELEQVPTARDPWSIISTIPGVSTDRVNVAGSEAGQQANFVGKGDDGDQTTWNMDGVEFTDIAAIGGSATYLDFNSFEQVSFATSGANFESMSPGVQMEFVTKQGSNRWTGTARFLYAESGMQDDNNSGLSQPSYDTAAPAIAGNGINEVFEKNFDIGGPLIKDNLWFWFGFTQNDIDVALITGQSDITKLRNTSAKLHGQFLGKGTYKGFYTVGDKIKSGRGGGVDRPPETTWKQTGPTPIYGAGASYFFTPDLEASFQVSHIGGGFAFQPQGDFNQQILQDAGGVYRRTFSVYQTDRPVDQFLAKGNYFFDTGSWDHELKFGFRYKTATVDSFSKYGAFDLIATKYYTPNYVTLYRELNTSVDTEYANVWVGDTVLKGPWTMTGGLHFSQQSGEQKPSTANPNALAPSLIQGVSFPGFDPGFEWSDISPRVGVSYTFDWERRLLLRANYGQYVDQLGSGIVSYNLPLTYVGVQYEWDDANGDDLVDWDDTTGTGELVDLNGGGVDCTDAIFSFNIDPCNTGSASSDFKIDPDLEAPKVDEFIVGADYELARDFTIGANITMRQRDGVIWTPFYNNDTFTSNGQLQVLAGSDVYECTSSVSGTAPDGRPFNEPFCTLIDPLDTRLPPGYARFENNMPGYKQMYNGIEFTATKRLSNKWMMRGFLSYSDWTNEFDGTPLTPGIYGSGASTQSGDPTNFRGETATDGSLIAVQSLASGNKANVFVGSSQWQMNVNGLYQLPKNWSVSGNVYGREGYGLADFVVADASATQEGNKNIQVDAIDTNRYDDLFLIDLRVAKLFTLERNTNVEIAAEVFNVTNENTTLQLGSRLDQTSYRRVGEIVSPRVLRLVATINF